MGAEVVAIEEVNKYAEATDYLRRAFGLQRLRVENRSLFECTTPEFQDEFDIVLLAGVLYHVTDPTIALRIAFNCLKDGGTCLIETYGVDAPDTLVKYEGPRRLGPGSAEDLNRGGWNWYRASPLALRWMIEDVGFDDVRVGNLQPGERLFAVARREAHRDILRAGLSQRSIR
jgi:SAM-dependent methyltransferase